MHLCGGRTKGERSCRKTVVKTVGDVPLCPDHLAAVVRALAMERGDTSGFEVFGVVYYVGDPDTQQVKIGCTTRLASRFAAIRTQRPDVRLLAIEPGYLDLERMRHRQFARDRVTHHGGNREWYHKTDQIMDHVNEIRGRHGDPWKHPSSGR